MKKYDENLLNNLNKFIKDYQEEYGKSPKYNEILSHFTEFTSKGKISRYITVLEDRNLIQKEKNGEIALQEHLKNSARIIAPLVGSVVCGEPINAIQNIEATYALPTEIFGKGETFLLKAKGDSMIDAGIFEDDILVVKKDVQITNGDIVNALIGDEATAKRFKNNNGNPYLHPENPAYKDIKDKDFTILGKVVSLIHNF